MTDGNPYPNWRAIDQATKAAASKLQSSGSTALSLTDQLLQTRFDRFLCRVFADEQSGWLLKGGTAMLARIPTARRTTDLDMASSAISIDEAVADLQQRVAGNLGDHMHFKLSHSRPSGQGDNQPYVDGRAVTFTAWTGTKRIGELRVDVIVGQPPTGVPETLEPATRLDLPRPLPTTPYRLYPIADQVADKVCATMSSYRDGAGSTRVKDLVDLVVIARTQRVDLRALQLAIATERRRQRLPLIERFEIPAAWHDAYPKIAPETQAVGDATTTASALELVASFLQPALDETPLPADRTWIGRAWARTSTPSNRPAGEPGTGLAHTAGSDATEAAPAASNPHGGEVYVPPHTRNGRQIAGYWRRRG